jgi:hypothetical protein
LYQGHGALGSRCLVRIDRIWATWLAFQLEEMEELKGARDRLALARSTMKQENEAKRKAFKVGE